MASPALIFDASSYTLTALSAATAVAALSVVALGLGVLLERRPLVTGARFFAFALCAAIWLGSFAAMYAAKRAEVALVWARIGFAGTALLPAAFFHFTVTLVGARRRDFPRLAAAWMGCGGVAAASAFAGLLIPRVRRFGWGWYPVADPWSATLVSFFTVIFVASVHRLWTSYRLTEGRSRERSGALLLAFVIGSLSIFDYLPSLGIDLQPTAHVAVLAFVAIATTAIWRFDFSAITPEYAASQILETMKGAVLVVDLSGIIRVVNRAGARMLGYAPEDLLGEHVRTIVSQESNVSTGKLLHSMGVLEQPMVWRNAEGGRFDVLASSSFLRGHDNEPLGVVYVASDYTERKRAEEELRRSEERYRELFENANDMVYTHDLAGRITSVNVAGERISGYRRDELIGTEISRIIAPEHRERAAEAMQKKVRGDVSATFYEIDIVSREGRRIPLELSTRMVLRDGKPVGVQGVARDVTERKENEARYRMLFERNLAGVYRTSVDGKILEVNEACARLFGYESVEEFLASSAEAVYFDEKERDRIVDMLREQSQLSNHECRMKRRDGSEFWVLENVTLLPNGVLEGTIIDITDRKLVQQQIEFQAFHDALTGLPNRSLFRDRVVTALAHAARNSRAAAVMFLDLDQFKMVNDTLGHTAGDRLLRAIGSRLVDCVRAEDTVARMGGDEFTILLTDMTDGKGAASVAEKVLEAVHLPVQVDEHELFVTTSIGIAIYPQDGFDAESLLKNADRAMYRAKEMGRDNYQFASPGPLPLSDHRRRIEGALLQAAERRELVLYYQPMVEIASGRVAGAEALVRWNHPELGLLQPDEFIPAAEQTLAIVPIGEWVLRTACAQMKAWHDAGHPWLRLAVNISPRQFLDGRLVTTLERVLAETSFPPSLLDLEITESTAMRNADQTLAILNRVKQMGIGISIDDFGTGYSSLSYLKRFPIDTVKIDQAFVRDLSDDDAAIISAVISMARALDLRVVAEGVETEEQLAFLQREHCGEMQGFLFSQPLAAHEFERALRAARGESAANEVLSRLRLTRE